MLLNGDSHLVTFEPLQTSGPRQPRKASLPYRALKSRDSIDAWESIDDIKDSS